MLKLATRTRGSDPEARAAAATGGRVGIFDLERRTAERFDEIHRAAADQAQTYRVDQQLDPVGLGNAVIELGGFGQIEAVLKARAAAALDRKPQKRRLE